MAKNVLGSFVSSLQFKKRVLRSTFFFFAAWVEDGEESVAKSVLGSFVSLLPCKGRGLRSALLFCVCICAPFVLPGHSMG